MKMIKHFSIFALAVSAWAQTPSVTRYGSGPQSLGASYLSTTKTVKSGSTVTAGHAVRIDTSGNVVVECTVGDVEFLGIAASTVTGDGTLTVEVATRGVIAVVIDNNSTVSNLAGIGTTTAGLIKDLGQTSSANVSASLKVVGKFLQAQTAGGGATALLQLYGPGHFGAQSAASGTAATVDFAKYGTGNDTTEDTLTSYRIPANAMSSGKAMKFKFQGIVDPSGGTSTVSVYFGATSGTCTAATCASYITAFHTLAAAYTFTFDCMAGLSSSTEADVTCSVLAGNGSGWTLPISGSNWIRTVAPTSDMYVVITGQNGSAMANGVYIKGAIFQPINF